MNEEMIYDASVADFFLFDSQISVPMYDTKKKTLLFDIEGMTPKPDIYEWCYRREKTFFSIKLYYGYTIKFLTCTLW